MRVVENPLHPALLRLDVEGGLSASTLDATLAAHPNCGFVCTIGECDSPGAKLLTSRGFTPTRRTLEGGWPGDPAAPLPDCEHGTLATKPDYTKLWLAAHRHHYFATHRTNPPAALDVRSWDDVFLGKDFRPEAAFFILEAGHLAAFSSLRLSDKGWEQAWFGTTQRHLDFAALNRGLVALETTFMAKWGIPSLYVEWDSTSPDAAWRTRLYPLENPRSYLTFTLIS